MWIWFAISHLLCCEIRHHLRVCSFWNTYLSLAILYISSVSTKLNASFQHMGKQEFDFSAFTAQGMLKIQLGGFNPRSKQPSRETSNFMPWDPSCTQLNHQNGRMRLPFSKWQRKSSSREAPSFHAEDLDRLCLGMLAPKKSLKLAVSDIITPYIPITNIMWKLVHILLQGCTSKSGTNTSSIRSFSDRYVFPAQDLQAIRTLICAHKS